MNKKVIATLIILMFLLQTFMPIVNATTELNDHNIFENSENSIEDEKIIDSPKEKNENTNQIIDNQINEKDNTLVDLENKEQEEIIDEELSNEIKNNTETKNEEIIENTESEQDDKSLMEETAEVSEIIEKDSEIEDESEENIEIETNEEYEISVASASGNGANAGNEMEFRNIFYNTSVGELTMQSSIRLNSTYQVNHNLRIDSSSQSGGNSLQLSSGCSIIVPSGCTLTLDGVVIDGRSFGNNDGKSCITVQSGGVLMLTGHSIIDGGTKNWGINVESGGQLLVESGQICYSDRGIVLQGSSYCDFASAIVVSSWGNTGKNVDIVNNNIGIYCGGAYRGTLVVNHVSQNGEKINFENNSWGIFSEAHSGSINIVRARMVYNQWTIYTFGNMTINNVNAAFNTRGIVNDGGTINFNSGSFYSNESDLKEYGIYNNAGTINIRGGNVYNDSIGIFNAGTINMSAGAVGYCTTGIENHGTVNFTGGVLSRGTYGVQNSGNYNMTNGQITNYLTGVRNLANFNISGGNIINNSVYGIVNEASNTFKGQVLMTGGNVTSNSNYDIYHGKGDTDPAGSVYGGLRIERNDTVNSKIFLALNNNYIYTSSNTPNLTSITLADAHLERLIVRTANEDIASTMANKVNVTNKGSYYCKANGSGHSKYVALWTNYTVTTYHKTKSGTILSSSSKSYPFKDSYTTSAALFEGYVLSSSPSNANGNVTGNVSVTYIYEDDRNVAIVNYKDLLSGVQSAVYWYNNNSNSFNGTGKSFSDGTVFEDYGYYKVTVINNVGLSKTITFTLDKDSV